MKIKISCFILCFLSCISHAKRVYLLEIASFNCPLCKTMNDFTEVIKNEIVRTNGRFVFAPFPVDSFACKEKIYYTLRESHFENELRTILYDSKVNYQSVNECLEFARLIIGKRNINWHNDIKISLNKDILPIKKTALILSETNISKVPSFVFVNKDGYEVFYPVGGTIEEKVSDLILEIRKRGLKND